MINLVFLPACWFPTRHDNVRSPTPTVGNGVESLHCQHNYEDSFSVLEVREDHDNLTVLFQINSQHPPLHIRRDLIHCYTGLCHATVFRVDDQLFSDELLVERGHKSSGVGSNLSHINIPTPLIIC